MGSESRLSCLDLGAGEDIFVWFPAVGDSARSFGRTALMLVHTRRLRVVAIDPPGYASGEPIPTFRELYAWAALAVEQLARNARQLLVAGNSSGGALAVGAASLSGCASGVILACWPDWRFGRVPTLDELCPRDDAGLARLLERSWHAPPVDLALRQRWLERSGGVEHRAHVASFETGEYQTLLERLEAPLAFVAGESDGLVPASVIRESARVRGAPLSVMDGVAHYPHLEEPRRFSAELAALWTAISPADAAAEAE